MSDVDETMTKADEAAYAAAMNENTADSTDSIKESEEVRAESDADEEDAVLTFSDLGLDDITLKAVERKGFVTPSPIQVLAIPRLLSGDANVIARARTGTGKTAAFGLPLTQRLREESRHIRAIILEPTRELAVQTATEMQSFTQGRYPRTCVVYGGASYSTQMRELKRGVEIVVGTPGRVQDHMRRGVLDISKIDYFILDEGDEMLDMGFIDDIESIFKEANPACRVLLFSATMPPPILKIAQKFMGEYEVVEEEGAVAEPLLIEQHYWVVREREKINALVRLIDSADDFYGLVFTQTKNDADNVCRALDERGYDAAALHGDVPQGQREKILARFRARRTRVLVATDVAARGIDITGLSHVVNYSLPFDGATYVHRIGRTGRAGAAGIAITFVRPEERRRLRFIESAIRRASKGEWTFQDVPSIEDVMRHKTERLFSSLEENIDKAGAAEKNSTQYNKMAERLCEGREAKDVVSALLAVTYKGAFDASRYGEISRANAPVPQRGSGRTERRPQSRYRGDWTRRDRSKWKAKDDRQEGQSRQYIDAPRQEYRNGNAADKRKGSTRPGKESRSNGGYEKRNRDAPRMDMRMEAEGRRRERCEGGIAQERGFGSRADKFLHGGYAEHYVPASKARPNVHTPTERSGSPGLQRQKRKPKERF